ncbi:MAG: fused MFS/spermidine synthase [Eggerthellaceae bacterium]|nr:fused MFS/spermidine synthase [Eggerthellaceae bacterium]
MDELLEKASVGSGACLDSEASTEVDPLFEEYTIPTMFGDAEVFTLETDEGVPVRVLYVAGGFQSASFLGEKRFEPVFEYYRAIDRVFDAGRALERVLMIGGGAFSYPKHLLTCEDERMAQVGIDVVEIDPAIVDIAREHFFLDELERVHGSHGTGRLGVLVADGADVLRGAQPGAYDVVVNDSFSGTDLTDGLLSFELLEAAKRAMAKGGLYVVNAVAETPEEAAPFARLLRAAFVHVYLLPCPDEEFDGSSNNLLIASDAPVGLDALVEL